MFNIGFQYDGLPSSIIHGLGGFTSKEQAMSCLFDMFHRWMSQEFFYKVEGEIIGIHIWGENMDEECPITFQGKTGWYDADCNLQFELADYPHTVEQWIGQEVDSYRFDNWRTFITGCEDDDNTHGY